MSLIELITIPLFNLIIWFISILPRIALPADFLTAIDTGSGYLMTLGYFLPLPTVAAIIGFYLGYYILKITFHAVTFFLAFIPFVRPNR